MSGDESKAADMGSFVRTLDGLCAQLGGDLPASSLVVHHVGWSGHNAPAESRELRERGSYVLRGWADSTLTLSEASPYLDGVKGLTLTGAKARDAERGEGVPLVLRQVVVDDARGEPMRDEDGDIITTCVVEMGSAIVRPERYAELRTRICQALEDGPKNGSQVREVVGGRAADVVQALEALYDLGAVTRTKGAKNSKVYALAERRAA